MHATVDLTQVGPGFSDAVATAQAVFRASLDALSRPGHICTVHSDASAPAGVFPAACAVLLALLDQDTSLYVAPGHNATASYFRFHTGCTLAKNATEADFLYIGADDALPDLVTLRNGSEYSPDHSATVVREVTQLASGHGVKLTGPGILGSTLLAAPQLDAAFVAQWRAARERFPRGVDIFLTCGAQLCGLPRTTRIEA